MTTKRRHLVAVPAAPTGRTPFLVGDIPWPDAGAETARAHQATTTPEFLAMASEHADDVLELLADHGIKLSQATMRALSELASAATVGIFTEGWVERSTAGAPIAKALRLAEPAARSAALEEVCS